MASTAVVVAVAVAAWSGVATADLSVSLPINLTALRRPSASSYYSGLRRLYQNAVDMLANTTLDGGDDCLADGQPCLPDRSSCCDGLRCSLMVGNDSDGGGGGGESWSCQGDSEEEAADRLDRLQATIGDDAAGSHPWAYSWEFQSKSEMEREEMAAAEEEEWKKNWKPKQEDEVESKLTKLMEEIKQRAKTTWQNVQAWKKLNELKGKIIDRYKQAKQKNKKEDEISKMDEEGPGLEEAKEAGEGREQVEGVEKNSKRLRFSSEDSGGFFGNNLGQEEDEQATKPPISSNSEESIIKFSDEIPKRKKKIDFRIDDIIKDGVDMIADKITANKKSKHGNRVDVSPGTSLEKQLYDRGEIDDTEDKLMREIKELKRLKKKGGAEEETVPKRTAQEDVNEEEVIRKHVATILDEERKLARLRKIEELKRLEQGLTNNQPPS